MRSTMRSGLFVLVAGAPSILSAQTWRTGRLIDSGQASTSYNYAPSIVYDQSGPPHFNMFTCANGDAQSWDVIRWYTSTVGTAMSPTGSNWRQEPFTFRASNAAYERSACDPSLVRREGWWYLFYSGNEPEGYRCTGAYSDGGHGPYFPIDGNGPYGTCAGGTWVADQSVLACPLDAAGNVQISCEFKDGSGVGRAVHGQGLMFVARAEGLGGPWAKWTGSDWAVDAPAPAVIISRDPRRRKIERPASLNSYGAGQQSVVLIDGTFYSWYYDDSGQPINQGATWRAAAEDGIHWSALQPTNLGAYRYGPDHTTVNSVDVKHDPAHGRLVLYAVSEPHTPRSALQRWYSTDLGLTWAAEATVVAAPAFPDYAHNPGVSGTNAGQVAPDHVAVAYGAGPNWADWDLYVSQTLIPMYRTCNLSPPYDHFYTTSSGERDFVVGVLHFRDEGIGWYETKIQTDGLGAVYRLYPPSPAGHYYTMNAAERDALAASRPPWAYERDEGAIVPQVGPCPAGTVEVFHVYNTGNGTHFFTTNPGERDLVDGWPDQEVQASLGCAFPGP